MALDTVQDYINEARRLLQDTVETYRFANGDYVAALNNAIMEARRIRPDLFIGITTLPTYSTASLSVAVAMNVQYRMAILYYVCGNVQLADEEAEQDARALVFMNRFSAQLMSLVN